jgi:hypothetical protein
VEGVGLLLNILSFFLPILLSSRDFYCGGGLD